MTTPDLSGIIPTKWKPWAGAVGAVLAFVVPWVTQLTADLPEPWPAGIALVIAGLTWLGIYHAPYAPKDTVLVPEAVAQSLPPVAGQYKNPYRQQP